jgi:hypothetical protein
MKIHHASVLALSLTLGCAAFAADPVTDAMNAAYAPYRVALFRTNSQAQPESEQAIARTSQEWQALIAQYAKAPPAPYNRDASFAKTLEDVAAVYAKASTEIQAKTLTQAHETLEKARDLMAELRRRNGVVVYSDHMNAYHAEMEHMLGDGPKWAAETQGAMLIMEKLGAMEYLAGRLRSEAPASVGTDPAFAGALQAVEKSLAGLRDAVLTQDAGKIRDALSRIKGPYSQFFLKFG